MRLVLSAQIAHICVLQIKIWRVWPMHVVLTSINNLFLINERPIAIALAMRTNKFSHCTEKECATGMTLTHKVFTLLHTYSHQIKHKNTSHNQSKHYLRMPFTTLLTQLIQTYSPSSSLPLPTSSHIAMSLFEF